MQNFRNTLAISIMSISLTTGALAGQFVLELNEPLDLDLAVGPNSFGVVLDEALSAGADSYAVMTAENEDTLRAFLKSARIDTEKISEVLFINSPEIGGGEPTTTPLRDGHGVYVIERPIPGVGFLGLDKKQKISRNSNAAIAKLGDIVQWDHSYLTGEGTYCVYRADSPETLREHGVLAGAPIGKITRVSQSGN
ncbi:nickel-binding protein [Shimia abyssi]|uniref:Uncharacterized protein DUF4242 n=1 Tax=Shimia abyssi TaxID=1662395 RepID=A0A2P8EVT3_9RHOB|nr:nickel-binding protein [Shimia abyssi]PSL13590.1 uncharacterized protein DUF4242 [Shimia abyssi]